MCADCEDWDDWDEHPTRRLQVIDLPIAVLGLAGDLLDSLSGFVGNVQRLLASHANYRAEKRTERDRFVAEATAAIEAITGEVDRDAG